MRINIAKVKIELVTNFAQNKKYIKLMDCKWLVDSSLRLAQKIFKSDHLWIARINATCANVNCKICPKSETYINLNQGMRTLIVENDFV